MAQAYRVSCTQCDVLPAEVVQGRVMCPSLFESAAGYCRHCDRLVDLEVPAPIRDLESFAEGGVLWDKVPESRAELVALAVLLRRRPHCPHCDHQALRLKLWETDEEAAAKGEVVARPRCRKCGEKGLRARVTAHLD